MKFDFKPMKAEPRKLTMALAGFSNSGKTYTAMGIARELHASGTIERWLMIDTDNKRSSIYADFFDANEWLDVFYIPYSDAVNARLFHELLQEATLDGYDGIIFDGVTPFWEGVRKHVTTRAEQIAEAKPYDAHPDVFSAWDGQDGGNDVFHGFLTKICDPGSPHVICTIEMKEGRKVVTETRSGQSRTKIIGVGPTPIFRPGQHKYRFNWYGTMKQHKDGFHDLVWEKTTGSNLQGSTVRDAFPTKDGKATVSQEGGQLLEEIELWMNGTSS